MAARSERGGFRWRVGRPWGIGVVAIALAVSGLSAVAATAESGDDAAPPELSWSTCKVVYECATAQVPLDHDEPDGETIEIALIKQPAAEPKQRIGTLFVHPGGPGNAVTDPFFFTPLVSGMGEEVGAKFDIVGIDPRGTGGSAPVTCEPAPGSEPVPEPSDTYPTKGQYEERFAYDDYFRESCAANAGPILDNMSTADSARDMELIRRSLGDEQLTFYGASYGAIMGQTYAAMYPDRVRAIAVDAVFDPAQWANGDAPAFARTESGQGTAEAVNAALNRCDEAGPDQCPLAGEARERWERVRQSLRDEPLEVPGLQLNDKSFVDFTEAAFQLDHMSGIPVTTIEPWLGVVKLVDQLRFGSDAPGADTVVEEIATVVRDLEDRSPDEPVGAPQRLGVWCTDTENPDEQQDWIDAGQEADEDAPGFGPAHSWTTSACASWPGSADDAYRGPFDTTTSTPLLMIGLTHDTTTPIAGAYSASQRFTDSRVIEVESWGHTALGKSSDCLEPGVDAYLLQQQLPEHDQVCAPDRELYG